jgi:hypothetical protein
MHACRNIHETWRVKDSKGSGGIVGITNQKSALVRWTLTRYFLASFSGAMNDAFFKSWFYLGWKFEHIKYIYRHPSRVICTVSNEEIGQHFWWRHQMCRPITLPFCSIPSAFWNALFEFHRSICDQTIETSVLLTKVEELIEDHVQHMLSCISSIHARINQKITKIAIGSKFPYRR